MSVSTLRRLKCGGANSHPVQKSTQIKDLNVRSETSKKKKKMEWAGYFKKKIC